MVVLGSIFVMPFMFDRAGMERYNNIGKKESKYCLNDNTGADFSIVPVGAKSNIGGVRFG
ncbi:hypothetical protein Psfp_02124 [Pelotomaculum sp. FP]|nr:hypothetical protein Psfp_02124 [Pelotomaculum sp. FP]